jgi:predicted lipoprotein with Yx(FWY)xxD motif
MSHRFARIVALAALAGALVACGGRTDAKPAAPATGQPAGSATAAATPAPVTATGTAAVGGTGAATGTTATAAATVRVARVGASDALVDASGRTLYIFKNDAAGSGKSACNGACATNWPPLTVTEAATKGAGLAGEIGTITRDDGTKQVTYAGYPLYRFAADTAAGDAKGAAISNWAVATAVPAPTGGAATPSAADLAGY